MVSLKVSSLFLLFIMSAPTKGMNTLTVPRKRRGSMNTLTVPAQGGQQQQRFANAYTLPPKDKVEIIGGINCQCDGCI